MFVSWGGMTPAYCSPEQIEAAIQVKSGAGADERTHLTRRTDIWSFGVSLLAMFFGKSACSGGGHKAGKVLRDYLKAPPASEILPAMPGLMADLLFGCFERDPKDRPQSMREIIDNLKSIYRDQFAEYLGEPVLAELKPTLQQPHASLLDLGRRRRQSPKRHGGATPGTADGPQSRPASLANREDYRPRVDPPSSRHAARGRSWEAAC